VVLVVDPVARFAICEVEHVSGGGENLRWAQNTLVRCRTLQIGVEDLRYALDLASFTVY
jgi:hypothetical protein